MKKVLLFTAALFLTLAASAGELTRAAFPMLQRLNAELVRYQVTDRHDPDCGAIICPGCSHAHTRAAEVVFPLAYEYSLTGDRDRLRQALALGSWLIGRQQEDGSWPETPDQWTGTTTDQALMLILAYPILEKKMSSDLRGCWTASIEAACDYLVGFMDNHRASINYCATASATLAEAYLLLGKESYRQKASALAHMVVAKMNPEGFIEGEGARERGYRYGVDICYDMEMSLWGLARYAEAMEDAPVMDAVRRSMDRYITFIYPDGMLDGSMGVRSNKWTLYGGGTSDGIHPLCALLSQGHPEYITAAVRNISLMSTCFSSCGLLGRGPDGDSIPEASPCIYPTFAKAKSMALALLWLREDSEVQAALPSDAHMCAFHQTLGTFIIREGAFCSTVSAYGYKSKLGSRSKNMFRPAGGAMTALWVDGYGLLQASSQTEYQRYEPMHFPELPGAKCLTPRIECQEDTVYYTNLFDFDAAISVDTSSAGSETCTVMGALKDRDGFYGGVMYSIGYSWDSAAMTKCYSIFHQTNRSEVRVVEPFVVDDSTEVIQESEESVVFRRGDVAVRVSAPGYVIRVGWEEKDSYRQIFPSVRALPLVISSPAATSGEGPAAPSGEGLAATSGDNLTVASGHDGVCRIRLEYSVVPARL